MIARPVGDVLVDTFQRTVVAKLKEIVSKVFTRTQKGMVPPPGGSGSTRFLCEDGEWRVP